MLTEEKIMNSNIRKFEMNGVGRVVANMDFPDTMPTILFDDGRICYGLERTPCEIAPLGYTPGEIAQANFIHEALHLYIAYRCGFTEEGVLRRAATGCKFDCPTTIADASNEERLVLGVQAIVNRSEERASGFHLHLIGAAIENARTRLAREYKLHADGLAFNFTKLLLDQNPVMAAQPR
jgi:hypothetical protein